MVKLPSVCIIFDWLSCEFLRVTPDFQVHEVIQDIQDLL